MPPERAFPVVFQMIEPIAGFDQRRPIAADGIGKADAVGSAAITDLLLFVGCRETITMNRKDFDRFGDVLEPLGPKTAITERQLLFYLVVGLARNADAAAFGDTFETGGNIDAVAIDVFAFDDDVADVHADAKRHLAVALSASIARRHRPLNFSSATDAFDGAGEFLKQPVAHELDNATAVLGNAGIDHLGAMLVQQSERARLALAHSPAVADCVGGHDRRDSALH